MIAFRHHSRYLIFRRPQGAVPCGTPVRIGASVSGEEQIASIELRVWDDRKGEEILYPADSSGDSYALQGEIWNCRCTLLAWVKGFEGDTVKSSPKMGGMSFEEWQHANEPKKKIKPLDAASVLSEKGIAVDISKAGKYTDVAQEMLNHLAGLTERYKADVVGVTIVESRLNEGGAAHVYNGKTSIQISARSLRRNNATDELRLGDKQPFEVLYHEFAHAISQNDQSRKTDPEFWREVGKIRRDYSKARYGEKWFSKDKISSYADTNIEEFMAEAFTQASLSDKPSPYALEVLELVKKYFGKK